jgi:hypothetical protein
MFFFTADPHAVQDFNEMAAVCNDQISEMIPCFSSNS